MELTTQAIMSPSTADLLTWVFAIVLLVGSAYFASAFLRLMETMIRSDQSERQKILYEFLQSSEESKQLTIAMAEQLAIMEGQRKLISDLYDKLDDIISPVELNSNNDDDT